MKKLLLLLLISACTIETVQTQVNTSPTDIGTPCFIDKFVRGHVYVNGIHYVAVNLPYGNGRLELYDENCNFLGSPMTLPKLSSNPYASNFLFIDMIYHNNSLYFYMEFDNSERSVLRYDINTEILDLNSRLSIVGSDGSISDLAIYNDLLFVSLGVVTNNFTVAVAADWNNPINIQYDESTGSIQTFVIKMNASDMSNPELFAHLKDAKFFHIVVENGIIGIHSGNLLLRLMRESQQVGTNNGIDRDIFFVEIDLTTGLVVHRQFYEGDATVKIVPNGDLLLTLASYNYTPQGGSSTQVIRNIVYLLDSNWNEKMNSGAQMSDNGNDLRNIHITENSIVIEGGLRNYDYENMDYDNKQAWMYFYLRPSNFQRTFIASGEHVEDWTTISDPISRFKKYDFTDNGFSAIGAYYWHTGPPTRQSDSQIVELNGTPLPVLADNESISLLYRRNIVIPTETFTPQLGNNGVIVHMGKKLVNGVITDSDQFDSVLVLDNTVDLNSLFGTIINPSYIAGGEASGWSVWADYAQYGIGNIQTDNVTGDFFVDIAMYDWFEFLPFHIAGALTRTKFQRVYLINEESLGLDDVSFDKLRVYPNPTNGILYISSREQIRSVRVTNMLGQLVKTFETKFDIQEIDLSDLNTGIYLITMSDGYNVETKKIIKKVK